MKKILFFLLVLASCQPDSQDRALGPLGWQTVRAKQNFTDSVNFGKQFKMGGIAFGLSDSLLARYTKTQSNARYSLLSHTQAQTTITGLPDSLLNHYTKAQTNTRLNLKANTSLLQTLYNDTTGIYNVLDYGAVGDGTTNDAVAIQNAVTAVEVTGGVLYFPHKTYKINSLILIHDASNLKIISDGATITSSTNQTGDFAYTLFKLTGDINNVEISGINFQNTATADSTLLNSGLIAGYGLTGDADELHIENLDINNCTFKAIHVNILGISIALMGTDTYANNVIIENNSLDSLGQMGISIISRKLPSATETDIKFRDFKIHNNEYKNTGLMKDYGGGISLSGPCERMDVSNNLFYENIDNGLECESIINSVISGNRFIGINKPFTAVYTSSASNENRNVSITGNSISLNDTIIHIWMRGGWENMKSNPFNLAELKQSSITGNSVENGSRSIISTGSEYITISGNKFTSEDFSALVIDDSDSLLIADNIISNRYCNSAFGNIGTVYFAGTSAQNELVNNHIDSYDGLMLIDFETPSYYKVNKIKLIDPIKNTGTVVDATGITIQMLADVIYYNEAAATDISANPQIVDGYNGQKITIIGASDVNTLTLDDGNGLQLEGAAQCVLGSGDSITFIYSSILDLWIENSRSNN